VFVKKLSLLLLSMILIAPVMAQQAPFAQPNVPLSNHDRVYSADQTSNTVSVIDPSSNKLLGVIKLGDPVPGALAPLYKGALLVHGLGYSPDSKTLAVVSVGSNSITFIDTATNKVKGTAYVGRSPHEAFFTPDGKELWVTVRGENYVSVIDPVQMREVKRIETANGPGMTIFSTDGKYGFVCSSFTPELDVIDAGSHAVVNKLTQGSPFCPNIALTPENDEVWITLKDAGKVQVFNAKPPFEQKAMLETGAITNHVNFANNANGKFAYVTIGGTNEVKVFRRGAKPELIATIPVGDLPHGIWPSGDGSRVYAALENGAAVVAIDTAANKIIANIPNGQTSQALVYVPNAVPTGSGTDNLVPLGEAANVGSLTASVSSAVFAKRTCFRRRKLSWLAGFD
jgi:YVTN family beta-propeller protein